ncbi:hypothetical protein BGW38_007139 [Lunasporangiospora selenospora]|uniref:RING-type E3 ubiquitin transferase n=1 Tax=Lunasporangiospora selenospora TaxID=979761 RepID=A0A9P6FYM0_9FUNG|nr:hypothetical protein BGW38_007139 [Lunasporangiospora selenospora]
MRIGGILYLLFFLWLLSGDDGPRLDQLQKALSELHEEADAFANKTYATNMTYPLPETLLTELNKLFHSEDRDMRAHYYHNVTGSFKGSWSLDDAMNEKINQEMPMLPPIPPPKNETETEKPPQPTESSADLSNSNSTTPANTSTESTEENTNAKESSESGTDTEKTVDQIEDKKPKYKEDVEKFRGPFSFNKSGSFVFNINEFKATDQVNWVKGTWRLRHDDNEDYGISLTVQGVHFVHNGSFYMWGIPDDTHMPLKHILDIMPNNVTFDLAKAALKEQYQKRIHFVEEVIRGESRLEYPESGISETSNCHYQMYMQLGAIDPSVRYTALKDLEREMANPQGITTIKPPHLNSTLLIYSPNCRLTLGVKVAEGMKREKFYSKAVNYAAMAGLVAFIQHYLMVRQMEYTPTPSVSFFSFVLVAIFGMRYMLVIWRIQRPERRGRRNQAAAAAAAAASTTEGANSNGSDSTAQPRPADTMPGGLPLPVTATRPTTDDSDSPRSDMQTLYSRFYWMLIISLIVLYEIAISSTRVQNIMISVCAILVFSFWIPQIVRNVIRGSKRGLSMWFVLGMSFTRLVLPVYFYGCPSNLMGHETTRWIWGLVLWVGLQMSVLLLQDWLGPRFFVPKKVKGDPFY